MEPSEQKGLEAVEGLLRVAEFEDEISALARQHRRVEVGVLVGVVLLVGSAIGVSVGTPGWGFTLLGGLLFLPWFLLASRAEMQRITESAEDLLLQVEEVKQRGGLYTPDDATVEARPPRGL